MSDFVESRWVRLAFALFVVIGVPLLLRLLVGGSLIPSWDDCTYGLTIPC